MLAALTRHRYSLSLTAAAAAWGIATVISKRAVAEIPPVMLLPVQLAASMMLLSAARITRRPRVGSSPEIRRLGALGVLNPGVSYTLSLLGLTYITASLSVLLWATEPVLIMFLALWLLRDRITTPLAAAACLALAGVALVVFEAAGQSEPLGIALTLAGVTTCAVYTVLTRKLISSESTLEVVAAQQAYALVFAVLLLAVVTLTGPGLAPKTISAGAWVAAVTSGILYYAVAFWFYLTGLRRVDAAVAGLFINLIPVFGIAAGYLLLDERLTTRQWVGAALIVIAVGFIAGTGESPPPRGASGERDDRVDLDEELRPGE